MLYGFEYDYTEYEHREYECGYISYDLSDVNWNPDDFESDYYEAVGGGEEYY